MGQCLGRTGKAKEREARDARIRKKLNSDTAENKDVLAVSANVNTDASNVTGSDVDTAEPVKILTKAETEASKAVKTTTVSMPVSAELEITKGESMAIGKKLPTTVEDLNKKRLTADGKEAPKDEFEEETEDIDNMLNEIEAEEQEAENFDNPFYMKIDRKYKVGQTVVYPPEMVKNMSFNLKETENTGNGGSTGITETGTSSNGVVQVTFAYRSLQGRTDSRGTQIDKPNQDSVAVIRSKETPNRAIFGVFDGHGPYGEHASHFCRMELLKMYTIALREHGSDTSEQLMRHTLRYLDRKFGSVDHKVAKIDPIVSGTTAVLVMLDGQKIIAANVGDSRAILATKQGNSGKIVITALTDDHKPERPDEKARIEQTSAILMNENQVRGGRPKPGQQGPGKTYICRHTNGEIVYGVLFTRSIGDVDAHKNLGVISDPEFVTVDIDEAVDSGNEQVIIIASDGIWDMMSNEEAAKICLTHLDPLVACKEIEAICAERWKTSGEGRRDDITVCVVGLGLAWGTHDNANSTVGVSEEGKDRGGSYYGLI